MIGEHSIVSFVFYSACFLGNRSFLSSIVLPLKSLNWIVVMAFYMKTDLHFAGIFTRYPLINYLDGDEQRFDEVNFVGMDKNEFVMFAQIFANENFVNVYYCMPDIAFPHGLRIIANDSSYMDFIEVGYACSCVVAVYMDHIGVNLL